MFDWEKGEAAFQLFEDKLCSYVRILAFTKPEGSVDLCCDHCHTVFCQHSRPEGAEYEAKTLVRNVERLRLYDRISAKPSRFVGSTEDPTWKGNITMVLDWKMNSLSTPSRDQIGRVREPFKLLEDMLRAGYSTLERTGINTSVGGIFFNVQLERNAWLMTPCYTVRMKIQTVVANCTSVEEPVKIMDREVKRLKQSCIPIVKVPRRSHGVLTFTWDAMKTNEKEYRHLFTNCTRCEVGLA
ncbi:hypothetical protein Tco_0671146 [Tanacetum coccineum]